MTPETTEILFLHRVVGLNLLDKVRNHPSSSAS